jgi:alkylation response protein AidB-like acyl-CoA dehydrogenase
MNVELAANPTCFEQVRSSIKCHSEITQIYEGTNQVQRVVMARQVLKG